MSKVLSAEDEMRARMLVEGEHVRQQLAQFLWRREGGHCVSYLVSTLAAGYGSAIEGDGSGDLSTACEQAFELSAPVLDYEEAATQAGWEHGGDGDGFIFHKDTWGSWKSAASWSGTDQEPDEGKTTLYDSWQECCDGENIEPYDREVYEHWIVSDWLADKLIAKGEKCDKDFAGLTVWARCTTGQSIALDGVMQQIALDLWPTADDQARILKNA